MALVYVDVRVWRYRHLNAHQRLHHHEASAENRVALILIVHSNTIVAAFLYQAFLVRNLE